MSSTPSSSLSTTYIIIIVVFVVGNSLLSYSCLFSCNFHYLLFKNKKKKNNLKRIVIQQYLAYRYKKIINCGSNQLYPIIEITRKGLIA
jgi:hypothetical protein